MKNRCISALTALFILVQAIGFSSVAYGWESVLENSSYGIRTAEIFDSLEIINYIPEETSVVTRIQFVATLMSLIGHGEITPSGKSGFADVKGNFSGMLDHAVALKLVSKGSYFRPDDAITYSEAMKMCLVLAGYEYECAAAGGWPAGVMSVGYRLDLNKGISLSVNDALSYDDAMTLLYNVLNTEVVSIDFAGSKNEETKVSISKTGESLLEFYHSVYMISGIITENSRTTLYAPKSEVESMIEINLEKYRCDKEYEDLIGQNVVAFVSEERNEAIAVFAEKNEITSIKGEQILNLQSGKVTYLNENEKKKSVSLENDYDVIYNGKAYTKAIDTEFLENCEYIFFIDNDRDSVCDVVYLTDVAYTLVEKVNYVDKVIYTHSELGKNIDLSKEKGQYSIFDRDGKEISIYMIESDMLLEAAVSEDGLYAMIKESDNVVAGAITSADFGNLVIEIDGIEYEMTKEFRMAFSNLSVGTKGSFYIGRNSRVVMYKKGSARLQYGYIIKTGRKSSLSGYQVKMLAETGVISVLDFADKVKLDSERKPAKEVYDLIEGGLQSNIVRFRTDDEGRLIVLDTAITDNRTAEEAQGPMNDESTQDENSLTRYFDEYAGSYTYKDAPASLVPKVNIAQTKVFSVPVNPEDMDDDTKYRVLRNKAFRNDQTFTSDEIEIFDVDKYGNCATLLYKGDITKKSLEDTQSAVVERIRYERNSEDVFEKKVRLLVNGKYESYFIGKDIDESKVKGGKPLCVGDIIRFNAEGESFLSITVDFDSSIDRMAKTGDIPDDHFNGGNQKYHYQAGKIYSISDKIAYFDLDSEVKSSAPTPINKRVFNFSWNNLSNFAIPKSNFVKVKIYGAEKDGVFVEKDREASIADLSEVETYLEKGNDADYAVLRQNAFEGRLLVIYKFEN